MDKYTDRVLKKLLAEPTSDRPILVYMDGKFHKATACAAKTRTGVKYNRLLRLIRRLKQ